MKSKKHLHREGFSLVEIIIVIAIMAILIGVIALAVIPNIQKSKESKDLSYLNGILSGMNVAAAKVTPTEDEQKSGTIDSLLSDTSSAFAKQVQTEVGDTGPAPYSAAAQASGSVARYKITMSSGNRAEITVWYGPNDDPDQANPTNYAKNEKEVFRISN